MRTSEICLLIQFCLFCFCLATALLEEIYLPQRTTKKATSLWAFEDDGRDDALLNSQVASKFKVVVCQSTSCSKRRRDMGMCPLSTFGALFCRAQENAPSVTVEEGPCLGVCKSGPCIAVCHEEFVGHVSLEGMSAIEFADRVFQNVETEADADRVWQCIENAIKAMAYHLE